MFKSQYLAEDYRLPAHWTHEDFWNIVERLEGYSKDDLLQISSACGIDYPLPGSKERIDIAEIMCTIMEEGVVEDLHKALDATKFS